MRGSAGQKQVNSTSFLWYSSTTKTIKLKARPKNGKDRPGVRHHEMTHSSQALLFKYKFHMDASGLEKTIRMCSSESQIQVVMQGAAWWNLESRIVCVRSKDSNSTNLHLTVNNFYLQEGREERTGITGRTNGSAAAAPQCPRSCRSCDSTAKITWCSQRTNQTPSNRSLGQRRQTL